MGKLTSLARLTFFVGLAAAAAFAEACGSTTKDKEPQTGGAGTSGGTPGTGGAETGGSHTGGGDATGGTDIVIEDAGADDALWDVIYE